MAKISLRSYNREIENQIDRGQIDEATAHCLHLLQIFPKHVDTYRLLGKAYLESQRYSDAADILQRVLSSVPDDFVSHVGMSIIREDEGNLDESITHMQRAFEIQPANSAIQDELRRLYGRKEGFEPPKIRLTRGALARMYAKGDLHQQAIAELRAALNEDPERLDLQALLARVYFLAGQKVEAVETSSQILRKLPYCLEANRIMAQVLSGTERAGEAAAYRERVQALDPYSAHLDPSAPTPDGVPDGAVLVERLELRPGESARQVLQGGWAASLGVQIDEPGQEGEDTPEWLATAHEEATHPVSEAGDRSFDSEDSAGVSEELPEWLADEETDIKPQPLASEATEGQLPDWMKSAGWTVSNAEIGETTPNSDWEIEPTDAAAEGELATAEIPDWLKGMAPESPPGSEEGEPLEGASEGIPDWLQGLEAEGQPPAAIEELSTPPSEEGEKELEAGGDIALTEPSRVGEEFSDWGIEEIDPAAEEVPASAELSAGALGAAVYEAASSNEPAATEPSGAKAFDLPVWLQELEAESAGEQTSSAALVSAMDSDWNLEGTEALSGSAPQDEEADSAWLEGLAARQGAEEQELLLSRDESREAPPEWIQEASLDDLEGEPPIPAATPQIESLPQPTAEIQADAASEAGEAEIITGATPKPLPDYGPGPLIEGDTKPVRVSPARPIESSTAAEIPDWLRSTMPTPTGSEFQDEQPAEVPVEAAPVEDLPEWLRDMSLSGPAMTEETEPVSTGEEIPADEEPDWLQATHPIETPVAGEIEITSIEEVAGEGSLPDWMQVTGQLEPLTSDEVEFAPDRDAAIAEGFSDTPEQAQPIDETAQGVGQGAAAIFGTQIYDASDKRPEQAEARPIQKESETPAAGFTSVESPEVPLAATPGGEGAPDLTDADAAFAWLESLAVRQGADEALLLSPEERRETPPDWVQEAATEADTFAPSDQAAERPPEETPVMPTGEEETQPEPESLPVAIPIEEEGAITPELPDWLKDLANEEPQAGIEPSETGILGEAEDSTYSLESAAPPADTAQQEEISPATTEPVELEAEEEEAASIEGGVPELPAWLAEGQETQEEESWTPEAEANKQGLDINQAALAELERLPGVGFILAQEIIAHRERQGPFTRLENLLDVPGFTATHLQELGDRLKVEFPQPGPELSQVEASAPNELLVARQAVLQGDAVNALEVYNSLIKGRRYLPEVIADLNDALYRFPMDASIWQALGDAHMRSDQLQEALDAYTKAEELLTS